MFKFNYLLEFKCNYFTIQGEKNMRFGSKKNKYHNVKKEKYGQK